ncbi:dihydrofolate reductase [Chitinophaga oryzae]|uniref:Dihydrofolate reductase n=1 Tax=Chitinophaga oryzae TaxID=2725414 RepID=A0AAE6ZFV1_9BACT|nr:dihydrofolate reductase family protein [Chitinophaga oryzae]QJB32270.1 dihydrofolate reductase [Chitinophaga oryzae]
MRKIITVNFITLDGVIQAPGGPQEDTSGGFQWGGWVAPFSDEIMNQKIIAVMDQPFDLLLGRRTYDIFAAHWPHYNDGIGKKFNQAEKFVVSHNAIPLPWQHATLITGDVVEALQALKNTDGPNLLVYGSSQLMQTLLAHRLADIVHMWLFPVTIGSGKRQFADGTLPGSWKLTDATPTSTGVIMTTYEPAGALQTRAIESKPPSAAELERRQKVLAEDAGL